MTPDQIEFWIKIATFAISICAMIVAVFKTRRHDIDDAFKAGSKRMDAIELRIQSSEQAIKNLPTKDHLHRQEILLTAIGGDMKAMRATMKGMSESMSRTERSVAIHEDHLMGGGKK